MFYGLCKYQVSAYINPKLGIFEAYGDFGGKLFLCKYFASQKKSVFQQISD